MTVVLIIVVRSVLLTTDMCARYDDRQKVGTPRWRKRMRPGGNAERDDFRFHSTLGNNPRDLPRLITCQNSRLECFTEP